LSHVSTHRYQAFYMMVTMQTIRLRPTAALALIPGQLSATEAAPLMCAGITTYNTLRNSGARIGDVVAILGIGEGAWPSRHSICSQDGF
jgi:NADPH:quinone reductase-like Zn-dependent oxidoreductase